MSFDRRSQRTEMELKMEQKILCDEIRAWKHGSAEMQVELSHRVLE